MEKIESALDLPSSPTVITHTVDQLEQELSSQIPTNIKEPTSTFGYVYTGKGYITQETFWFHSCIMLNCINTVQNELYSPGLIHLHTKNRLLFVYWILNQFGLFEITLL